MKGWGYLALAAAFGAGGASLWAAGEAGRRTVEARGRLLTLQLAAPVEDEADEGLSSLNRLPWLAAQRAERRERQATARYWLAEYDALAGDTPGDDDPRLVMFAAHAAFRRIAADGSDPAAAKQLEEVLALYADVLARDPSQADAAYNYEFVARRRHALALAAKRAAPRGPRVETRRPGRTLHGERGATPAGLDSSEFKVIVPQPSDEREEQREAGGNPPRVRKG